MFLNTSSTTKNDIKFTIIMSDHVFNSVCVSEVWCVVSLVWFVTSFIFICAHRMFWWHFGQMSCTNRLLLWDQSNNIRSGTHSHKALISLNSNQFVRQNETEAFSDENKSSDLLPHTHIYIYKPRHLCKDSIINQSVSEMQLHFYVLKFVRVVLWASVCVCDSSSVSEWCNTVTKLRNDVFHIHYYCPAFNVSASCPNRQNWQ